MTYEQAYVSLYHSGFPYVSVLYLEWSSVVYAVFSNGGAGVTRSVGNCPSNWSCGLTVWLTSAGDASSGYISDSPSCTDNVKSLV